MLHLNDEHWMRQALVQAQLASDAGEVPVGAVIVSNNQCIAAAHNTPILGSDPTAHAEINVLRQVAQTFKNYRLQGCTLYVTLEPCAMCAMAMLHARVDRVVFGAFDSQTGAAGSVINLFEMPQLNHQTQITGGVLNKECSDVLKQFFTQKRTLNKKVKVPLREDALRTPLECFVSKNLSTNIGQGSYISSLSALQDLQMHYHYLPANLGADTDKHPPFAQIPTLLCVHDENSYSQQYADLTAQLADARYSILLPDLIGFGRSDKPKKEQWHTPEKHAEVLTELIQHVLAAKTPLIIIAPESMLILVDLLAKGLGDQIKSIHLIKTLPVLPPEILQAPFPDQGHRCGPRSLRLWGVTNTSAQYASTFSWTHDTLEAMRQSFL